MSRSDQIAKLLLEKYFKSRVPCGPNLADQQSFLSIEEFDAGGTKVPYCIPHEGFHPRIAVAIDFFHAFTKDTNPDVIKAQPLVDRDILYSEASRLRNLAKYYFDFNYEVRGFDLIKNRSDTAKSPDEVNAFLNEIFNYFISSVSVTRSRRDVGSATITLKNVRNYRNGVGSSALYNNCVPAFYQLIVPMLPIRVWARGRFYTDYYFPIFDGYIVGVSNKDSSGFFELELACKDVLEIARFSSENIDPALCVIGEYQKMNAINLQGQPFYGHDHMTIVRRLFIGGYLRYLSGESGIATIGEEGAKYARNGEVQANYKVYPGYRSYDTPDSGILLDRMGDFNYLTNLATDTVGEMPKLLESRGAIKRKEFTIDKMVHDVSHTKNARFVMAWGEEITPYRIFGTATPDYWTSEFASRLDVLQQVAEISYYDFYVDGNGTSHYHPQMLDNLFLNNDAAYFDPTTNKLNKHKDVWSAARIIGPEELIGNSPGINIESMITFVKLRGKNPIVKSVPPEFELVGTATHREFLSRFGYRRALVDSPMFNYNLPVGPKITIGDLLAIALLQYQNAELYTTTAQLIFRPELEICRPVYFVEDKTVFYINSITHSINVGGDATTTVNGSFGRKATEPATDLQSFVITQQAIHKFHNNTGKELKDADIKEFLKQLPIEKWSSFLDNRQTTALKSAVKDANDAKYASSLED
jgi:hypothetical protein